MKDSSGDEEADLKMATCPEWVRRTICCTRWEVEHADATMRSVNSGRRDGKADGGDKKEKPKVILAVLYGDPNLSPLSHALKLADNQDTSSSPVPLPAPSVPHANKFEARSSGVLVTKWAEKAGIETFPVEPTLPGRGAAANHTPTGGDEEERPKRAHHSHHGHKGRRSSNADHQPHHPPKACLVERPPAVMAMMEMVSQPSRVVRVLARGEKLDPDP
jgi:hypothetical protein